MTVKVLGNYPTILRRRTGLFSLDVALSSRGELGIPLRTVIEVYGYPNVGKSTLSYYLAGKIAEAGCIALCDLEMMDIDYVARAITNTGFSGDIKVMSVTDDKGKPISHEQMLMEMVGELSEENVGAAILDSIGAVQPISEAEGDFGEAFMGKRAKLVAQLSRASNAALRNKVRPSVELVINHVHSIIGGRGHDTAGGVTLKHIAAARLMLWSEMIWKKDDKEDATILGFQVKGQVEKLRYGGRGRTFGFYIVPGYGVHAGASAMFDCFDLGLAEKGATVKLDGKSLGYIRKDLLSYAAEGKTRKFAPFIEKLTAYEKKLEKELKDENSTDD